MADAPIPYVCADCGAEGVKLWREYQMFLNHQVLRCAACALENQKGSETVADADREVDGDGMRRYFMGVDPQGVPVYSRTDQIGWLVPAVLTAEGDTFWGYTSCPQDRVEWWRALPTSAARNHEAGADPHGRVR